MNNWTFSAVIFIATALANLVFVAPSWAALLASLNFFCAGYAIGRVAAEKMSLKDHP